jgi:hypothetical protein
MRISISQAPILLLLTTIGCTNSGSHTRLQLIGNPRGPATYEFRQTLYRQLGEGPEFIGYGQHSFDNSPLSRGYDPKWPRRGFVTFRLHVVPQPAQEGYVITILGPSGAVGPGDSEVLTGAARPMLSRQTEDGMWRVEFKDVLMRSRNHPQQSFTLSGTILARHAEPEAFGRELAKFTTEMSYRGP